MDRLSQIFTKTQKQDPKNEVAKNANLLIRAGFIHKEMAGVYAFLPLGLKVMEKIKEIVRAEMSRVGGQEIIMTTLQRKELWEKTDRWSDDSVDVWFKSQLKNGKEVGLGWSHEEQITEMMKNFIASYKDLPIMVYQFQNKLRNETRAKSGIMRCREFVMKDLYSYSSSEVEHDKIYQRMVESYHNVYRSVGIGNDTYYTYASGGAFTSKFSHEFQTICDAGEDLIYIDENKKIAINQEILNEEVLAELNVKREDLREVKAAEVGNIFSFGSTKSEQLELYFSDENGKSKPVILGSYGIGITRLMGTIVEKFADSKGIVWPRSVAPYDLVVVDLLKDETVIGEIDKITQEHDISALIDDRDLSAGEKLADSDLMGIPFRVVLSERNKGKISFKKRDNEEEKVIEIKDIPQEINS